MQSNSQNDKEYLIPITDKRKENELLVPIDFKAFITILLVFPFFSFIICVLISVIYHFESANHTHCNVYNILPSISASVGSFTPQKYIWRTGIAMQSFPRFYVSLLYYNFYRKLPCFKSFKTSSFYKKVIQATFLMNVIELSCLVCLTYVSSTENYEIHKIAFSGFVITSLLYMLGTVLMMRDMSHSEKYANNVLLHKSLRYKKRLMVVNVVSIILGACFFLRHNSYCEAFVYTLFALSEYTMVLSNMAFHWTAAYDFPDVRIAAISMSKF